MELYFYRNDVYVMIVTILLKIIQNYNIMLEENCKVYEINDF